MGIFRYLTQSKTLWQHSSKYTNIIMAKIKKTVKDVEGLEFSYTAVRRKKFGTCFFFSIWYFLKKLRCTSSYSTFGSLPKINKIIVVVVHLPNYVWLPVNPMQHARAPCPSLFPKVCLSSYPLHQWCQPAIHPC